MPRYIDADKLKQRKRHIEFIMSDGKLYDGYDFVKFSDIDETPTADVQEVKHGNWLINQDGNKCWVTCSCCGIEMETSSYCINSMKFCPNCGTKMDRKENYNAL